jgi:hypothetical protein
VGGSNSTDFKFKNLNNERYESRVEAIKNSNAFNLKGCNFIETMKIFRRDKI